VVAAQTETQAPTIAPVVVKLRPQPTRLQSLARTIRREPRLYIFGTVILVEVVVAIFAPLLTPYSPYDTNATQTLQQPSWAHPLGTDSLGRDQLTRVLYGARISLAVAVIAVFISLLGGVTLGLGAGYLGGWLDNVLSRFIDAMLAFPGILLAIAVTSALGPNLTNAMIAVGLIGIPLYFRLTRGQTLQAREQEFVTAAAVLGSSKPRILFRHILPNIANPMIVAASISASSAILALAALSFIGVGPQPPEPDWGSMINAASSLLERSPWLVFGPGVAIFLTVLSFSMFGDGLRDALDPRLRNR